MNKAILSRFADQPALVACEHAATFEGLLEGLMKCPDWEKLTNETAAANDDDFWADDDDSFMARVRPYSVQNGILTIPVKGVLLNDFPYQFFGYATGYEYIRKAFERGMADDAVKGIALHLNTPGGAVAGNFDLVDRMHAFKGTKPVRAFAHEFAYSAGYSIASVADEIVMSRTGGVGSIGVVTMHIDASKALDRMGWKVTFIHFGKHKVDGNSTQPLDDDAKKRIQARVDQLGEIFVSTVARNRGMDAEAIRNTEALTYTAPEAVSLGLADSVAPLDEAMADFQADTNQDGVTQMSTNPEGTFTQAQVDESAKANYDKGHAEGKTAGHAEGLKEGATAERARISTILSSEAGQARPKAAMSTCLNTDMSAEAAEKFLSDLPEENGQKAEGNADENGTQSNTAFMDAMNNGTNPEVGSSDTPSDDEAEDYKAVTGLASSFGLPGFKKK
ncbi:serine peptidase [Labrenzia sp. C1B10]|uniref:S49 family peptidase n=1 Tax=unclassified Labrenzia TaxID=2648686 RepID=UPI0003B81BF7|nr:MULTISPECIES: S49 family peptidase [unclassified Labrenzia]ERP95650.1 serine peptidase [Labrenzia sp. C1B10]ERS05716.1 serine peptidase [Labrenzia sp. C1B70]